MVFLRYLLYSQATNQKSNSQAPDRTYTFFSVKTPSQTVEITANVFAGAENEKSTLKSKIYLRNSQKLLNSISIFS